MLQLLLLRHAKSSWDDGNLPDAERPLAPRGKRAAAAIGRLIAESNLLPARVLCSPALRAAETWRIVAAQLPRPVAADVIDALYDFGDGGGLLDVIRDRGGTTQRLMLVGHNPALENLAARLIGAGDPGLCAKLQAKFPTAALAVIVFPISDWAPLAEGSGELTHFIRPRDLKA